MSTQTSTQETLAESADRAVETGRERAQQAVADAGALYGRRDEAPTHEASVEGVCRRCGRSVPSPIQRVAGDNQGCVPACEACWETDQGRRFATLTRAAKGYRHGVGQPVDGQEVLEG